MLLAGSTAFARGLMLLALPILTRIYSPIDFEVLAIFVALTGVFSAAACLRFELAVPLPESDNVAANLLVTALGIALLVSVSALISVVCMLAMFPEARWLEKLGYLIWLWPAAVLVCGLYNALQYWATRRKWFESVAKTRVVQGVGGAGSQLLLGFGGVGPVGLIAGYIVSVGAGIAGLYNRIRREDRVLFQNLRSSELLSSAREYSRFPTWSSTEALANGIGNGLPIILIASLVLGPEAGFVFLAMRMLGVPMALIGTSVGQVYLSEAAAKHRSGQLGLFSAKVFNGLIRTGVGPLIFAGITVGPFSEILFGRDWGRVGELILWMTPWFVMQLLGSPVSMVMQVKQRQKLMLGVVVAGVLLRAGSIFAANYFLSDAIGESFAVASAVYYLLVCLVVYRVADVSSNELFRGVLDNTGVLAAWFAGGLALRLFTTAIL